MKKSKKTALAVVGLLSAACITTGVAGIKADAVKPGLLFAGSQTAIAYAATQQEMYAELVGYATTIATKVKAQNYTTADEYYADDEINQAAFNLLDKYINNWNALTAADQGLFGTAVLTGMAESDELATAQKVYDKITAFYHAGTGEEDILTYSANFVKEHMLEQDEFLTGASKNYFKKDQTTVEGKLAVFTSLSTEKKAAIDKFAFLQTNFTASEVVNIVNQYFADLQTRIDTANDTVSNIYVNASSEVVLGSNDEAIASAASKKTITQAETALAKIYGTLTAIPADDDSSITGLITTYNAKKADYDAIIANLDQLKAVIEHAYTAYTGADKLLYTFKDSAYESNNTLAWARTTYTNLPDDADNDQKALFATEAYDGVDATHEELTDPSQPYDETTNPYVSVDSVNGDTVDEKLAILTAAWDALDAEVQAVKNAIAALSSIDETSLYSGASWQQVIAARAKFEALPAELSDLNAYDATLTDIANDASIDAVKVYIDNFDGLVAKEIIHNEKVAEVEALKAKIAGLEAKFNGDEFNSVEATQITTDIAALDADQQAAFDVEYKDGRTYKQTITYWVNQYSKVLQAVSGLISNIALLPDTFTMAIYSKVTDYKATYDSLPEAYQDNVTNRDKLLGLVEDSAEATAQINAWKTEVNKLVVDGTPKTISIYDAAQIATNVSKYGAFSPAMQTYISSLTSSATGTDLELYNLYQNYVNLNTQLTNLQNAIKAFGAAVVAIPEMATTASGVAISDFNDAFEYAQGLYNALPGGTGENLSDSKKYVQQDYKYLVTDYDPEGDALPGDDGLAGNAWRWYLVSLNRYEAYKIEKEIDDMNATFSGYVAYNYATGEYTMGTIPVVMSTFNAIEELYAEVVDFNAANDIDVRNLTLITAMKDDVAAQRAKYQTLSKTILEQLGITASINETDGKVYVTYVDVDTNPDDDVVDMQPVVDFTKLNIWGGDFDATTPVYTLQSVDAKLGTLTTEEKDYIKLITVIASYDDDSDPSTPEVQVGLDIVAATGNTVFDNAIYGVNATATTFSFQVVEAMAEQIDGLLQGFAGKMKVISDKWANTPETLTDEDFAKMNAYIAEYATYSVDQKKLLQAEYERLVLVQTKSELVNYIETTIENLYANVTAGELTEDGYALANVMKVVLNSQDIKIFNMVSNEAKEALTDVLEAYEADETVILSVKALKDAINGVKGDLEEAIADVEDTLADYATVDALEDAVAVLEDTIDDLEALDGEVDALETRVNEFKQAYETKVAAIDTAINNANTLIATKADATALNAAKTALEGAIADLQELLEDADEDIKAAFAEADGEILETLDAEVLALNNKIAGLETKLNENVDDLNGKINTLKAELDSVRKSVTTITIIFAVLLAGAAASIVVLFVKGKKA